MIGNKKILTVITARAGSKGILGKNYRDLMGQPLFMWSVFASLSSKYVDKTVISSNCPEIEKIYKSRMSTQNGWDFVNTSTLTFIKRPEEISGDSSTNEEALIHAYNWMKEKDEEYDVIVNLQPTSPCRFSWLLDDCIEVYSKGNYKSLFTASKHTPFFWQKRNGKWKYVTGNNCCERKMRQEFIEEDDRSEFLMHDNGNIYITDASHLLRTRCRINEANHMIYETQGLNNLQIDEEYDFMLIESKLNAIAEKYGITKITPISDLTDLEDSYVEDKKYKPTKRKMEFQMPKKKELTETWKDEDDRICIKNLSENE